MLRRASARARLNSCSHCPRVERRPDWFSMKVCLSSRRRLPEGLHSGESAFLRAPLRPRRPPRPPCGPWASPLPPHSAPSICPWVAGPHHRHLHLRLRRGPDCCQHTGRRAPRDGPDRARVQCAMNGHPQAAGPAVTAKQDVVEAKWSTASAVLVNGSAGTPKCCSYQRCTQASLRISTTP